jgi:nicotinamidase-related amidase
MREANDRGFECVMLTDCTGATDRPTTAALPDDQDAGVFGAVADSAALLDVIGA